MPRKPDHEPAQGTRERYARMCRLLQERNCTVAQLSEATSMCAEAVYSFLWTYHAEGLVEPAGIADQPPAKTGPKPVAWRWRFPEVPAVAGLREYLRRYDVMEAQVPGLGRRAAHDLLDLARVGKQFRTTDITAALRATGDLPEE